MPKPTAHLGRIGVLWRGDEATRRSASPETSRFKAVFAAFADVGVDAEPVITGTNRGGPMTWAEACCGRANNTRMRCMTVASCGWETR